MALNYLSQEINPNTRPQAQAGNYMGTPQQRQAPGAPGFDMNAMLAAFAQMQQQQQQGQMSQQQNYFDNTNALGRTAMANQRPMGLTPENQWSAMFGGNAASAMTPEARMQSQGNSAINQWRDPIQFQGSLPPQQSPMDAAVQASPPPFQLHPSTLQMAGLQSAPGTLQSPERVPAQRAAPVMQGPPAPPVPRKRKGSSFGMIPSR